MEAEKLKSEQLRAKLKTLTRKHDEHKLEAERVQHLLSEIASLKGGHQALKTLLDQQDDELAAAHASIAQSEREKVRTDGLEKKLQDMQHQNDELRRKLGRQEIEEERSAIYQRELQQMRDEKEDLKQQVGAHAERVSVASKNLTAAENDRARLEREQKRNLEEIRRLQASKSGQQPKREFARS